MIKNYNNLVSLCGGQGYSFEKVLYTEMEEANYAIKLVPTIDSYNYIYIYRNGDKWWLRKKNYLKRKLSTVR